MSDTTPTPEGPVSPQPVSPNVAPKPPTPPNGPFPLGKVCPTCGSKEHTKVPPKSTVAFGSDRVCKRCGTRYTPPTPVWASIVFILVGGAMTGTFGLVCIPIAINLYRNGSQSNSTASPMALICPLTFCILGVLALVHGIRSISTKR